MEGRAAPDRIDVFGRLLDFLNRLDAAHVHYTLLEELFADVDLT